MKCPHCLENFHAKLEEVWLHWAGSVFYEKYRTTAGAAWVVIFTLCPACARQVIFLERALNDGRATRVDRVLVQPKGIARAPVPQDVPQQIGDDYREACLVLADSPKASAALSRRCLQHLLRTAATVKPSDLSKEIDEVLASKALPSHLAAAVDAIRVVGNFAAHPIKATNTGAIFDVEPGEAELLLDVLEGLFDFYFVQPAVMAKKLAGVSKKLADAGKPPLKE